MENIARWFSNDASRLAHFPTQEYPLRTPDKKSETKNAK